MKNLKEISYLLLLTIIISGCPKTKIIDKDRQEEKISRIIAKLDSFSSKYKDNLELQIGVTNLYMKHGLKNYSPKSISEKVTDLDKTLEERFNLLNNLDQNNEKIAVLESKWLLDKYLYKRSLLDYFLVRIRDIKSRNLDKIIISPIDSLCYLFPKDIPIVRIENEDIVIEDINQAEIFLSDLVKNEVQKTIELIKEKEKIYQDNACFNSMIKKIYISIEKNEEALNQERIIKTKKRNEDYSKYFNELSLKVVKSMGFKKIPI